METNHGNLSVTFHSIMLHVDCSFILALCPILSRTPAHRVASVSECCLTLSREGKEKDTKDHMLALKASVQK